MIQNENALIGQNINVEQLQKKNVFKRYISQMENERVFRDEIAMTNMTI